ncbi:MAG: YfcE family phosphodiesterase [Spirochaetes bacterium]|nr:YfcE family phosphodiesterase [Spirochaetota bacterium]
MSDTANMRWAIFSDTHGNPETMRDALAAKGPFDAVIHLGDGVLDAAAVSRESGIPLIAVSGNEDGASPYPERLSVPLGTRTALLLHGHRLDLNPYLPAEAWEKNFAAMDALMAVSGAQVLLFGHTHVPVIRRTEHGILCNPGSHYVGSRTPHTFAIAETVNDGLELSLLAKNDTRWDTIGGASLPGPA